MTSNAPLNTRTLIGSRICAVSNVDFIHFIRVFPWDNFIWEILPSQPKPR